MPGSHQVLKAPIPPSVFPAIPACELFGVPICDTVLACVASLHASWTICKYRAAQAISSRGLTIEFVQVDCLPKLVSDQWRSGAATEKTIHARTGSVSLPMASLDSPVSELHQGQLQYLVKACPAFRGSAFGAAAARSGDICCSAYMATPQQLCRRVNTLQSLLEVNREMASSEAGVSQPTHSLLLTATPWVEML